MTKQSYKPWRNWYHCMGNTYGTWLPGDPRGFRSWHHREHVEGDYKFPPPPGVYDGLWEHAKQQTKRGAVFLPYTIRPLTCRLLADTLREQYQVEVVELSVGGIHFHLLARFVPVGVEPYEHLAALNIKLTHTRKAPKAPALPGGGRLGASADGNANADANANSPPAGAGGLSRRGSRGLSAYDHDPVPRRILGLARSWVTRQLKQRGHFTNHVGGLWAQSPLIEPVHDRKHQLATANYIRRHAAQRSAVYSQLPPAPESPCPPGHGNRGM